MSALTFDARQAGGFVVGAVRGDVDMASAPDLRRELARAVPNTVAGVVLDLTEVPYIDSAGIRVLFNLAELLQARRQQLRVVVPDDAAIRRVLRLVDLDRAAPIHSDVEAALAAAETALADPL